MSSTPESSETPSTESSETPKNGSGEIAARFALPYLVSFLLMGGLVWYGGVWHILAYSRVLRVLVQAGLVSYTAAERGITNVPDLMLVLTSKGGIYWQMLLLTIVIYVAHYACKGIQYAGIARYVGCKGKTGDFVRAYFYGDGVGRFLPLEMGEEAKLAALEGAGVSTINARKTFSVAVFLVLVFEIALFAAWGMVVLNWGYWFAQLFWGLVILFGVYIIARPPGNKIRPDLTNFIDRNWQVAKSLANSIPTFWKLGILGALAMLLDDVAPFTMMLAFSRDTFILDTGALQVSFLIIQAGVVCGYIATRIPFTAGGVGIREWAFTGALIVSGVAPEDAVTIAILDFVVRHGIGTAFFLVTILGWGVPTSVRAVIKRYVNETSEIQDSTEGVDGGPLVTGEESGDVAGDGEAAPTTT